MTTGSTMPIVTTMEAGVIIAAAVHPGAPARTVGSATAAMIGLPRRARGAANAVRVGAVHPLNVLSHHSLKAASFLAR